MRKVGEMVLTTAGMEARADDSVPTVSLGRRIGRLFVAMCLFGVCAGILAIAPSTDDASNRDFVEYWAIGQILIHHPGGNHNPYDIAGVMALEKESGLTANRPFMMRNPPVALVLTLPFGLVGERVATILWSLGILGCVMGSVQMLWTMHGRPEGRLHLLLYLFAPVIACLLAGQSAAIILLGLVLFLKLYKTRPFGAGAAVAVCAIKPHLLLAFALTMVVWVVYARAWRVFAGAVVTLAVAGMVPLLFDPLVWPHYLHYLKASGIDSEFIPVFSTLIRVAIDRQAEWLQFVPAILSCLWAAWYFAKNRTEWDWNRHGLLLMLVCVFAAPYAWMTDETILLPAIFAGLCVASGRMLKLYGLLAAVALGEIMFGINMPSGYFIWTPVAWLLWYLSATYRRGDGVAPVAAVA